MRLEWLRSKAEIKDVLLEPKANGPEIAYWIFSDLSSKTKNTNKKKWQNMTVIAPGLYGNEFPKTYGHYHTHHVLETYKLTAGEGIFILQKKFMEKGQWNPEKVSEIYMVKLSPNEEIVVPHEFAHSWSNIGDTPLVTFDDWDSGHVPTDYEAIKRLKGMCFYIVNDGGIKFVPNPRYKNHPEPKILTAKEFQRLYPVA
jgi:oxalate decarboxylase/phosphoglucose isomerase-like protein (cupin superfamily)